MDCHYTSASAGTGKTYTLTHKLADIMMEQGSGRTPRAIVTTFSRASATELKTRTRSVLYESQHFSQAETLDTFLIGTVDSIAESFLRRYWNTLGLSPDATIISDDLLSAYISDLMRAGEDDLQLFSEVRVYQPNSDWRRAVLDIVEKASMYGLTLDDLHHDRDRAVSEVERIYSACGVPDEALRLSAAMMASAVDSYYMKKPRTGETCRKREDLVSRLMSNPFGMQWLKDYGTLASDVKKTAALNEAAGAVYDFQDSVFFGRCMVRYAERIWAIALDLFRSFSERKRVDRKLTYTDLETCFLALLDRDEVKDDVRSSYTHLFVDEFQDSSALQVRIFLKLAGIIGEDNCHFYGDTKQVIYSWRAADPDLTEAVISGMQMEPPLSVSYRTVEPIVGFTNDFFGPVFPHDKRIGAVRKGAGMRQILRASPEKEGRKTVVSTHQYVAEKILRLLKDGALPSQIAVLARTRDELKALSLCLAGMNIPFCMETGKDSAHVWDRDKAGNESQMVFAMLGLLGAPDSNLDNAMAICSSGEKNINDLVSDYLEKGSLSYTMPLGKEHDDQVHDLSVSESVRLLVSRAGLFESSKNYDDSGARRNTFMELIRSAEEYETECRMNHIPASADGFREKIMSCRIAHSGDPAGVCLSTIHKAKGLEWRYVILMEPDADEFDDGTISRRNLLGTVSSFQETKPSAGNLYPKVHITYMPPVDRYQIPQYIQNALEQEGSLAFQWNEYQRHRCKAEAQRTLYVAMTRAKDGLILVDSSGMGYYKAARQASGDDGLDLFNGFCVVEKPAREDLGDRYEATSLASLARLPETERTSQARDVTPSGIAREGLGGTLKCGGLVFCGGEGSRLAHAGKVDDNVFGDCIHHLFAIPSVWKDDDNRLEKIGASYGVTFTEPAQIRRAWQRLVDFLSDEGRFGKMEKVMHELPFKHRDCDGRIITGDIDLVWKTSEGCVIVDYKTFQGRSSDIVMHAEQENYASQISCYKSALEAAGEKVVGTYLYFPVLQALMEIY